MKDFNSKSPPSSSGARITGDELQHLVAWYWCLKAISQTDEIESIALEAKGVGNVDDVVITFKCGKAKYIQVKAATSNTVASIEWLTQSDGKTKQGKLKSSLLQRLYKSWLDLNGSDISIELVTSRFLDASDDLLKLLDHDNTLGPPLRKVKTKILESKRKELADHLKCTEEELCKFLDVLVIRLGQTESEWHSKINDVALAVDVQNDEKAIQLGVGYIRKWVRDTRDSRTPAEIRDAINNLQLWTCKPRTLVVVQGGRNVKSNDAAYILRCNDWNENADVRVATTDFVTDLKGLREDLILNQTQHLQIRGSLSLPTWFTVGHCLSRTAGFELAIDYKSDLWDSSTTRKTVPEITVLTDTSLGDGPLVVVVAISTDHTELVKNQLHPNLKGRLVTLSIENGPNQMLIDGDEDALLAAMAIREWVQVNSQNSDVHLVLITPAPLAAFLGWCWNRMPKTTVYDYLPKDGYRKVYVLYDTIW